MASPRHAVPPQDHAKSLARYLAPPGACHTLYMVVLLLNYYRIPGILRRSICLPLVSAPTTNKNTLYIRR